MADFTDDLGPTLWIVNSVFTMVATVTVIGRLAARKVRRMAFGADDWIICIALLLNWAMFSLAARGVYILFSFPLACQCFFLGLPT